MIPSGRPELFKLPRLGQITQRANDSCGTHGTRRIRSTTTACKSTAAMLAETHPDAVRVVRSDKPVRPVVLEPAKKEEKGGRLLWRD